MVQPEGAAMKRMTASAMPSGFLFMADMGAARGWIQGAHTTLF